MSDTAEPQPKPEPKKKCNRSMAEKIIDWKNINDVSRRFALALKLLEVLDSHEVDEDSEAEEDSSEALAVFQACAAYLMVSFAVSEKDACASYRRLFRIMKKAQTKLMKTTDKQPTARDIFTEVAVMDTEDE